MRKAGTKKGEGPRSCGDRPKCGPSTPLCYGGAHQSWLQDRRMPTFAGRQTTFGSTIGTRRTTAAFLVEPDVAETRRKEAATGGHAFTPEYDRARARRDFFAASEVSASMDTFKQFCGPFHRLQGSPFGDDFMLLLHRWAASLDWPQQPLQPKHAGAITFLQLCLRFCIWSRSLPPLPVYSGKAKRFVSWDSEAGKLQLLDFWVLACTFREAVEHARRSHDMHFLPASRVQQLPNLRSLSLKWDLPGTMVNPTFSCCEVFERTLLAICEEGNISPLVRFCQ